MPHRPTPGTEQVTVVFAASPSAWGVRAVLLGAAGFLLAVAVSAALAERVGVARGPMAEAVLGERLDELTAGGEGEP